MSRPVARCGLVALLSLASASCTTLSWLLHPPARLRACPGAIPAAGTLGEVDRAWRDRARYRGEKVDVGFVLVAEKQADRLVLVALNNFGAQMFSVVQRGDEIEVESSLGRALQVPPETVLRDWYAARTSVGGASGRLELARPECGYTVIFVPEAAG